jgi:hypothetical protein
VVVRVFDDFLTKDGAIKFELRTYAHVCENNLTLSDGNIAGKEDAKKIDSINPFVFFRFPAADLKTDASRAAHYSRSRVQAEIDDLYQVTTVPDRTDSDGNSNGDGDWYTFMVYRSDLLEEFQREHPVFCTRLKYRWSVHNAFMSAQYDMKMLRAILIGRM